MMGTAEARAQRMRGFEARRKGGTGQVLDRGGIDRRGAGCAAGPFGPLPPIQRAPTPKTGATELFRKFPSINVSPSRTSSLTEYYALSAREGGNPQVGACPMQVYLDRVPLPTPFNLDLLPSPKDLAGIEVYSGAATIPPQFNGFNRGCGVILVWTRDGY